MRRLPDIAGGRGDRASYRRRPYYPSQLPCNALRRGLGGCAMTDRVHFPASRSLGLIVLAVLLALFPRDSAAREETVTVEASTRYERNRLHQFTFGGGYRELWKAPVELPVLDLKTEGGGLTPTKRFGGNQ